MVLQTLMFVANLNHRWAQLVLGKATGQSHAEVPAVEGPKAIKCLKALRTKIKANKITPR